MFFASSVFMFIILSTKNPSISQWDEFSFWATSQKLTKAHGAIYSFYDSSLIGKTTPPALAVLSAFFQPIGTGYLEWKAFFAYDVLLFSAFSAWTAAFKKERWHYSVITYLFGFLTPFIFEVYTKIVYLAPIYISLMADIPLGVVFAGAVAVYLFGKREGCDKYPLALVPVLVMLTQIKDMGFAFSLIIVFIVFCDMIFAQKDFVFLKIKGLLGKITVAAVLGSSIIISFMSWTFHMGRVLSENRFELGGDRNMGMAEMLITGIKELLSSDKSQKFLDMQSEMINALLAKPVSIFGNGIITILIITAIFIFAAVLAKRKEDIIRIISLYTTGAIGFIAYYIFHIFIYAYIFKANAYGLPSYERYVYPYYIAWLAMGVMAVCISIKNPRKPLVAQCGLYAFVLGTFGLFSYYVSLENTFIAYNGEYNSAAKNVAATVDMLGDAVGSEDRIFCYSDANDSGQRWFIYTYELSPNVIVRDMNWFDGSEMNVNEYAYQWRENLIDYMRENKITHFLLDYGSENLQLAFGEALGNHVEQYGLLATAYFKVKYIGEDEVRFELVKKGQVGQ